MTESRLGVLAPGWLKHNDLIAALARRFLEVRTQRLERVIFTATTGRSGTKTLAKLFSMIPGCAAVHEPEPVMNESVLKAAVYGNTALVDRVYRQVKSINILRAAAGHRYYLEANHLFAKTFIEQAVGDFGGRIAVVHLVRSPVDVAMSIYRLQHLPGTEVGDSWWLDYRAPTNIMQMAGLLDSDAEFSHPFYRGLWYWYEFELRFAALRARFPSMRVTRFETEWLNDRSKVFRLLDDLGIEYEKSRIESGVGRREHTKADKKVLPPLARAEAEQMDVRFRQLLQQRGVDISAVRIQEERREGR